MWEITYFLNSVITNIAYHNSFCIIDRSHGKIWHYGNPIHIHKSSPIRLSQTEEGIGEEEGRYRFARLKVRRRF